MHRLRHITSGDSSVELGVSRVESREAERAWDSRQQSRESSYCLLNEVQVASAKSEKWESRL